MRQVCSLVGLRVVQKVFSSNTFRYNMEGFISHFQIFIHITDAWGTEFYVGIPGSNSGSYYLDVIDVYLKILAQSAGKVTVTNGNATSFDATYDVSKGITTMQIPSTLVHNYAYTYQNMGFRISSTVQVSVIMTTYQENTMAFDSMLLLPTVVLSTEYVVPFSGDMSDWKITHIFRPDIKH